MIYRKTKNFESHPHVFGGNLMMLYKYLTADRIDVLQNCLIRYTQPGAFNDPFEVKPHISKLSEEYEAHSLFEVIMPKELRKSYDQLPVEFRSVMPFDVFLKNAQEELGEDAKTLFYQMIESNTPFIRKMLDETFNDKIGILSLTEKPNNLLMWAHYASNYEGYITGFDATHPYFKEQKTISDEFRHLRKVEYRQVRPSLPLIEMTGVEIFLVKSMQWSYEQEWRILRPLQDADKIIESSGFSIHLFQIPPMAIKEVILGCRMKDEIRTEIITTLKNSQQFQHVKLIQTKVDETEFKLTFHDITI